MLAETIPQDGMKDVGHRVVSLGLAAALGVDHGSDGGSLKHVLGASLDKLGDRDEDVASESYDVYDPEAEVRTADLAGIRTDLALDELTS